MEARSFYCEYGPLNQYNEPMIKKHLKEWKKKTSDRFPRDLYLIAEEWIETANTLGLKLEMSKIYD